MLGRECGTGERYSKRQPRLMRHDQVELALHQQDAIRFADGVFGVIKAVRALLIF